MKKKITIEISFFIISLITVFFFIFGIFLAIFSDNWDLGMFSFVISLSGVAILFFFANIFESFGFKIFSNISKRFHIALYSIYYFLL